MFDEQNRAFAERLSSEIFLMHTRTLPDRRQSQLPPDCPRATAAMSEQHTYTTALNLHSTGTLNQYHPPDNITPTNIPSSRRSRRSSPNITPKPSLRCPAVRQLPRNHRSRPASLPATRWSGREPCCVIQQYDRPTRGGQQSLAWGEAVLERRCLWC